MSKGLTKPTSATRADRKTPCIAGGQVTISSDGYAEYKASQQEDTTYQDLRESTPQGDATYQDIGDQPTESHGVNISGCTYVNESVINRGKINTNDNAEYEEVKNK